MLERLIVLSEQGLAIAVAVRRPDAV